MFFLNPKECIEAVCGRLADIYEGLKKAGVERKSSDTAYEIAVPHIYAFLCPPDDRNKYNFPCKSPSITVTLDTVTMNAAEYTCNGRMVYCCGNASTLGSEIAHEQPDGGYLFDAESDEYTGNGAMRDLYETCIQGACKLLQIAQSMRFDGFRISDLSLDIPDTRLPDFPYAQAQISFSIKARTAESLASAGWALI